ncbi:MAG: ketosteroid isomerase-related protein [Pseudomonadota bacterium]
MSDTETLIRRYYDAFNAGDTEAMIDCLIDDIRHDVNEGQPRIGKDAFRAFCAHMTRCYREELSEIAIMTDAAGTRAAAEFIVSGTYLATDDGLPEAKGQTYRLPAGTFFEIAGGRIARVTTYYNLKEWVLQVSA